MSGDAPHGGSRRDAQHGRPRDAPRDAPHDAGGLPDLIALDGVPRGAIERAALLVAAGVFFVLGVVFWLVPVVTGVPFYVLAAVCAGMASRRAAAGVNRLERKLPHRVRLLLRRRRGREPDESGPRRG
jgi:hypothetical protein